MTLEFFFRASVHESMVEQSIMELGLGTLMVMELGTVVGMELGSFVGMEPLMELGLGTVVDVGSRMGWGGPGWGGPNWGWNRPHYSDHRPGSHRPVTPRPGWSHNTRPGYNSGVGNSRPQETDRYTAVQATAPQAAASAPLLHVRIEMLSETDVVTP